MSKLSDKKRKICLLIVVLGLLVIGALFGIGFLMDSKKPETPVLSQQQEIEESIEVAVTGEPDKEPEKIPGNEEEGKPTEEISNGQTVDDYIASMTLEQKIYQMFIVAPEKLTGVSRVTAAGNTTKEKLQECPVGGLIYFPENLVSTEQTKEMLSNVQSYAYEIEQLPLFLCIDEEGGRVARIANNSAFGVTNVGPMSEVTSEKKAYQCGDVIGGYMKDLGFNVNFAPVADVITNSSNTVIGTRSFGTDPGMVARYGVAYSNGLHSNGILSTFKHFPGHGATEGDTHNGYAYTLKSYEEMKGTEMLPFYVAGENGVDMVMVAHISVPNIVGDDTPCSLSKKMITDILRNDLGYNGLVVTDALNMGAITQSYDSATTAVKAVEAGVDLLLMPKDFNAAYNGIYQAVKNGQISEDRIDESVRRIISAKLKIGK